MLGNYFKIALRNLIRHKGYSIINILGLTIGLASCLIILGYVQFERSFDTYHSNEDRIYRVEREEVWGNGGQDKVVYVARDVAAYLKDSYPEIEQTTRLAKKSDVVIQSEEKRFYESVFLYAEPSLFDLFDINLRHGNALALNDPGALMLSSSMAQKYFGDSNPMGKIVELTERWSQEVEQFEVVGVFEDMLPNSHFKADFLGSMTVFDGMTDMRRQQSFTYFMLKEGASIESVDQKLAGLDEQAVFSWAGENTTLYTIPLSKIHLYAESRDSSDIAIQGDIRLVYLFSVIAMLICLLACINYMNLATARAMNRSREIGIRKVSGAMRSQLIWQLLGESILFVCLATILAIGLAQISLPIFNQLLRQSFTFNWFNIEFTGLVMLGVIIVGIFAGSYPALYLSRFQPSSVLKGTFKVGKMALGRKSLVVFQFAVSIGFVAATAIIYQQLQYVTSDRLGFEQEQRLVLKTHGRLGDKFDTFKEELLQQASVTEVAASSAIPALPSAISFFTFGDFQGADGPDDESIVLGHIWAGYDFVKMYGFEVAEGRVFSTDHASDWESAVMLNQTAVKKLGLTDPVGTTVNRLGKVYTVIGVLEDFHLQDLKKEIEPLFVQMGDADTYVTLKIAGFNFADQLKVYEKIWDKYIPSLPFNYQFVDDVVAQMYEEEVRLGRLFAIFAGLAIFVACLGLFGLASYTTLQRAREIGIRKVLGASTQGLIKLLSEDYLKLVFVAFLIASPLAYFTMDWWLESFAYRIDLNLWLFVGAGLVAMVIALATVSYQSIKTALANPVDALQRE